ncbi:LCP family protein [Oscillibacter sp. KLE 1728]|uniref:LCP family protein n=1 Tax=Oscillibacter sp. KLE 1728 TaxID=1226322 RepID=UPI0008214909|nr:LCP family protein [Oscillibacter sp. KLE 1728]SCH88588.1 Regulatory protein msrR [uncultured Oscillibacter sp.]
MDRENGKHPAGGTPKKSRPKKPKKPSRLTRQQKLLIAVAVVLAIVLIAVVACQSLFVRPDLPDKNADADSETQEEEIDWGEGTRPRSDGERKSQDYYTVLILGRDTGGGGNTDTMLLASYDVTNQKATVMSIPRDTMVNVSWDIKRINSVYNYYGGGDRGIQYLYKEIAQLVGFEPDYQVVVEWDAVGQIVDAMGGVWFDVPRNMNYDDPYQDLHIHQEKGYRLLTGDDAMQVLRYRHDNDMRYGYPDGDLGRIKTQQAFLTAMVDQLLQIKNVTKINQFIQVFQNNVETDLSFQNILWFAQQAILGGLSMENVEFVTMPNRTASCWSRTYHNYQSYVVPSADELLELVNTKLSPYTEVFTLSDLDIMSVNSDGSISSSTGHVEDSRAARPPVKPTTPSKPEEETPTVDENGNPIDPDTGLPVTPDGGTTDPGTGGTTDPGSGTTDPGTGTTPDGGTDPGTGGGTTGPDTGEGTTGTGTDGTTDPGTGTSGTPDGGTPDAGGGTTDSGTGDSQASGTGDGGGDAAAEEAPDDGFIIVS